jgi:hypothetical protein
MNYTKPEVAVLGNATRVIELLIPQKQMPNGVDAPYGFHPAYDLDE